MLLISALSIDKKVGNFVVGKEFDALLINLDTENTHVDVFEEDSLDDCLDKFLYTGIRTCFSVLSIFFMLGKHQGRINLQC